MYKIYGKEGCVFCVKAKKLLDRKNIHYNYIDIDENEQARHFVKNVIEAKKVPQIFDDVNYVGGYTDLVEYLEEVC